MQNCVYLLEGYSLLGVSCLKLASMQERYSINSDGVDKIKTTSKR